MAKATRRRGSSERQDGALLASISQAAEALDHHRQTIAKLIRQRGIKPTGSRRGHDLYLLREIIQAERTTESGELVFEKLSPFERAAWLKSEESLLRIRQKRGELCEAREVEMEFFGLAKRFCWFIETLPDVIERDVALSPAQATRMQEAIDAYREELAKELKANAQQENASCQAPTAT